MDDQQSTSKPLDDDNLQRLGAMIDARHPCIVINTDDEQTALELVERAAVQRGLPILIWSCTEGILAPPLVSGSGFKETENPAAGMYYFSAKVAEATACVAVDLITHLDDPVVLRSLRDAINRCRVRGGSVILIDHVDKVPSVISAVATMFDLALPDVDEIEEIVRDTIRELYRTEPIHAALKQSEFKSIILNLRGLSRQAIRQIITDCALSDMTFDAADIANILVMKRRRLHGDGVLEFVEAPVDLNHIGGLRRLKQWLSQRERALDDAAKEFGLTPPRGVLLLGVQGAGKSLSAKAIATAWQRPLLRLDPSRLYDRYIGESEQRLRAALHQAERMAPIVLWIDEIEKGFASAASRSNDGGLSQRMFGSLLTWMQEHEHPVFLVATANDIEALPPELLRKGRFDEIFFVDLPDAEVRALIFNIHLNKRGQDTDLFDRNACAAASDGFSGAEIEQAIISAMHHAFHANRKLEQSDLLDAIKETVPLSVTMRERIATLRDWASTRCVPAD